MNIETKQKHTYKHREQSGGCHREEVQGMSEIEDKAQIFSYKIATGMEIQSMIL